MKKAYSFFILVDGHPIFALLDGVNAFEEVYRGLVAPSLLTSTRFCITFQLLDKIWDDMDASYMDFQRISAAVILCQQHVGLLL